MSFKTLNFTRNITKAILMASLAVSFVASPANAQYMVIDGVSASPNAFKEPVCCQTIYVQDYSNFSGINDSDKGNELTSTAIMNSLFDGFTGAFGTCIFIPAILIAVLRLFVNKQNQPRKQTRKTFELPAAPAASAFYRPARNY